MAEEIQKVLTDDLERVCNGRRVEGARTRRFAFDGEEFEIDLTEENYEALADMLGPYLDSARKVTPAKARRTTGSKAKPRRDTRTSRETPRAIRAWAEQRGIALKPKGRIPDDVKRQYVQEESAMVDRVIDNLVVTIDA